ncbi:GNAT family N-acetyltransferase [Aeromicrobium stalagmiti]|uniref:GNAT family N-acetyltransferase n=1 Tax=Aeromicrobium stalagmiti TaxID=2738988 RepID=UPI00156A43B0|nr:GNAT family N-acetyltransferase [Aeromicrobium stalagmiti]
MDIIETERLVLRPYVGADAQRVLDIYSDIEVLRWLGDPPHVPMHGIDAARERIAAWAEQDAASRHEVHLAAVPRGGDELVANVLVKRLPDDDQERYEVGWSAHPDAVGHGYVTEAARALLDAVFADGLDEVWCTMYPDNAASAAVATRLGLADLGAVPDRWYGGLSRMFHTTREGWVSR